MEDINWGPVLGIAVIAMLLGGLLAYGFFPRTVDGEGKLDAEKLAEEVEKAMKQKNEQIDLLRAQIAGLEFQNETDSEVNVTEDQGRVVITGGYLMDEIFLNESFNDTISDREVKTFFDGDVEYDNTDYNVKEILTLTDLTLLANADDFKGETYLTIPKEGILYEVTFSSKLNVSKIGYDDDGEENEETLKFNLLGNEVEITEWDKESDDIVFTQGEKHFLEEGESVTFNNKTVTLEMVFDEAIYVSVDSVSKKIEEGDIRRIEGVEIKASEVLYSGIGGQYRKATILISDDVEYEISDGDEYEENSIWEWIIYDNTIGLILVEEFEKIDNDFNALASGESICLPNNHSCVRYDGIVEGNVEEYKFELDNGYIEVRGNFATDDEDYDIIYIDIANETICSDDDDDTNTEYFGTTIGLRGTDSILELDVINDLIVIEDFNVDYDLNISKANGIIISNKDDDYRTNHGILIEDPEDSSEDQEFNVLVPEEKLEATVTVY